MKINEKIKEKLCAFDAFSKMNVSDIIFHCEKLDGNIYKDVYVNFSTGKSYESIKEAHTEGRPFILAKKDGYLFKYFPDINAGVAIFYRLSCKEDKFSGFMEPSCEEYARILLTSDDYLIVSENKDLTMPHFMFEFLEINDLSGQLIENDTSYIEINGQSGLEMMRFMDNELTGPNAPKKGILTFNHGYPLARLIQAVINSNCEACNATNHIDSNENSEKSNMKKEKLYIPKKKKDLLEKCAYKVLKNIKLKTALFHANNFISGIRFSCVQKQNGEYVLHNFMVYIKGSFDVKEKRIPLEYYDYEQIVLEKNVLEEMHVLKHPLIYFDKNNIEDSSFKYCVKYIEKAEEITEKILTENYDKSLGDFEENYFCLHSDISIACAVAFMPFCEKVINFLKVNENEAALNRFKKMINECGGSLKTNIGEIAHEEKELHKMLKVSKPILKFFSKNPKFMEKIKFIKYIFCDNNDYMMSMEETIVRDLFSFIDTFPVCLVGNQYNSCLKKLIKIFGPENCVNYAKFISRNFVTYNYKENSISKYDEYLQKLEVVGKNITKDLQWKLKGDALDKAIETISPVFAMINDKKLYAEKIEAFKKLQDEWKQYEYSDGEFIVTYPKGPTEIAEEGLKLNHCVKTFIDPVAIGETTILFIRRKERPLKPFYTMEIIDGHVIQCHGNSNSIVSEYKGLDEFLLRFCSNKNIVIDLNGINETFAAGEF